MGVSYALNDDESPLGAIASNKGWNQFRDWAEQFDPSKAKVLAELLCWSYTYRPAALAAEIEFAREHVPPDDEETESVINRLLEVLNDSGEVEATDRFVITTGVSGDFPFEGQPHGDEDEEYPVPRPVRPG